jgi:hypothetical protein
MLNRELGAAGASRLSREAAASISQIIVTLTLLLASAGPTNGFLAYSCGDLRNAVASYALAPREGCWVKPPLYSTPEPRDGRILWIRDGVRFPVIHCKMTETVMQADCDSRGRVKPWKVVASEKQVPIGPMSCLEVSMSRKATLFNRTVILAVGGTAMDTLEERVNYDLKGHCPGRGNPGATGKAYARLTVRGIVVWEREATESLIKKSITRGANDVLPNYIAGGMDAAEGTYVWNYTVRSCPEEELEELYSGRLGVLDGRTVMLSGASDGQGAWLRLEKRVTICGRRMRQTHLPHVYVEWVDPNQARNLTQRYTAPMEERELESMRLDWSYLVGRDDYKLRRDILDAMTTGCWMKGMLAELRQLQAAGQEGTGGHRVPLWVRSLGAEKRRGRLCCSLWDCRSGAQKPNRMHTGDTCYVPGEGDVRGPLQPGAPAFRNFSKVQKEDLPRWRIGKEWICGYPEIQSCNGPGPLPGHRHRGLVKVTGTAGSGPEEGAGEDQSGADEGRKVPQETLDALARGISDHCVEGCGNLGSVPAVVGTAMMGVSVMEMVTSTIARMTVLYARKHQGYG